MAHKVNYNVINCVCTLVIDLSEKCIKNISPSNILREAFLGDRYEE